MGDATATGIAPDDLTPSASARARIQAATMRCVARFGLSKTTLEDIARDSGISRATLYRLFPGGRAVLFHDVLAAEVDRFFDELATAIDGIDDLEDLVVAGVGTAMRFLRHHAALRTMVALEPGLLLPRFSFGQLDLALATASAFAEPHLRPHLGEAARTAAEHLARIVLSYSLYPTGRIDPSDEDSIRELVRHHVLPGLRAGV